MAIYVVDFDGTLAVTRFPEIVEPKRKIVAAVKMLKANFNEVCNANIRRNVWRVAGSVKGAKRNPVARWGTKTTGLELNTHIITQDIEEIKRFFSIYRKKGGNNGDKDYFSGSRSRNIDFGSPGPFCLCGSSKSLERII